MADPLDTNVVLRFLVEDPADVEPRFRGVFSFFDKLERGERTALLPPLVVFQSWFVLTSYYGVPGPRAAAALQELLSFKGISVPEKAVLRVCLDTLGERSVDLVDAYLAALYRVKNASGVYSFDKDFEKLGVPLLAVE